MDIKSILNQGFGSPGETTRVITREFVKLKSKEDLGNIAICYNILEERARIYNSLGADNVLDDYLINKIVTKSNGEVPFVILADIFITTKAQSKDNVWALLKYLDEVLEVVMENYNSMVSSTNQMTLTPEFKDRINELFEFLYPYRSR